MKETIRTFIAIKITAEKKLLDSIAELKKSLAGEEIRWVDIDNLHLTLRFLGETTHFQLAEIIKMIEIISKRFQPFHFELKGVSVFKKKTQPRVLFVSIKNELVLKQLAAEILEMSKTLGFNVEEINFNPHLTLGRIKFIQNKAEFYALINRFFDTKFQEIFVSEIVFFQSILGSKGPTYTPIKIVNLN